MSVPLDEPESIKLQNLDIGLIRANARNPRLEFPQAELDKLAESIELEGILVPVVVFPKEDHFVLVDGERRFKSAQTLGLTHVPALITPERSEHDVLVQMFNIHMVREPWKDMPTARALARLAEQIEQDEGSTPSDSELRDVTGLSVDRVRQLRYVVTLPEDWQGYISEGRIPLNFFWELKRNIVDLMEAKRPELFEELGGAEAIARAFVTKRIDGVISDTVGLRKVRPLINFASVDASRSTNGDSFLDASLRDLVLTEELSIDDVYEDTVLIMVEVDKLDRRVSSMIATFDRLLTRSDEGTEREEIFGMGDRLVSDLQTLLAQHRAA